MNMCEVCQKPIPRTATVCEECDSGLIVADHPEEEKIEQEEFVTEIEADEEF